MSPPKMQALLHLADLSAHIFFFFNYLYITKAALPLGYSPDSTCSLCQLLMEFLHETSVFVKDVLPSLLK